MTNRHDAALRAALAERDRRWRRSENRYYPLADDELVAHIVEAALAAADAHEQPWISAECARRDHDNCKRDFGLTISPGEKIRPLAVCKCLCHGTDT